MKVSINEAEVMATKAAWGAGRPWGLAQEAGRAVAWLEAMRLPGAASLLALLVASDGMPCEQLRPGATRDGVWQGAGPLCPVLAGAYISDSGGEAFACSLREVYSPLLLVPFASLTCANVQVAWGTTSIVADRVAASVEGSGLGDGIAATVLMSPAGSSQPAKQTVTHSLRTGPVDIADEIWEALSAFAHRTYVPASESSRLKGAGAGLTDND